MENIKKWIMSYARDLEKVMYQVYFEDGNKKDLIRTLKAYQNSDGGFGNSLEPDFRNSGSNPIACQFAANILHSLNLEKDHPMIQKLINYLINTQYKKDWFYYFRIPSNNDYPHAPWWHHTDDNEIEGYNPTASIIGFLYRYMDESDPMYNTIEQKVDQAISYFINHDITEMHELKCFNELYEYICECIDCSNFRKKLMEQNLKAIEQDANKWFNSYSAKPTQVIVSMHSPGVNEMMDLIHLELVTSFNKRNPQGVFDIPWEWGQYNQEFENAKIEWMGIVAIKMLKFIKEFKVEVNTD